MAHINVRQGGGNNRKMWSALVTLADGEAEVQTGLTRITEVIGIVQAGVTGLNEGFAAASDGGTLEIDSSNAASTATVQVTVLGY